MTSKRSQLLLLFCLIIADTVRGWRPPPLFRRWRRDPPQPAAASDPTKATTTLDYDMIIVGAGASGMFAAGASTMLGQKTLLLDLADGSGTSNIGGDCTNSACVPSKALRSIGKMAASNRASNDSFSWITRGRKQMEDTVNKVRARESPDAMVERNPNLDLAVLTTSGRFVDRKEMDLAITNFYSINATKDFLNTTIRVRGNKWRIQ